MEAKFDAVIAGAGPAGCSAAWFLARAGFKVLLLDRAVFPRDKVCGDGVSAGSLAMLEKMGVLEAVLALDPFKAREVVVTAPGGAVMKSTIPSVKGSPDYGLVVVRKLLDNALLEHVSRHANITVLQGFSVNGLLRDRGRVTGVRGQDSQPRDFGASFVVGADGAHSVVAKSLGMANRSERHRSFALRAYFENVRGLGPGIEIHFDSRILPGYGWIFPLGGGRANVGAGIGNQFRNGMNPRELFQTFVEQCPHVKDRLKDARMAPGSLRGWPLHNGCLPSSRQAGNVLLAGDAGSFIDPMSGEGIFFALKSGELAALAIHRARKRGRAMDAGPLYQGLWRRCFFWKEFAPGFACQYLMSQRSFVDWSLSRCARNPKKARVFCGAMSHTIPKARLLFNL